jgi:hypothetical protein
MAVTESLDSGTGAQTLFPFTFEYLKATDVKVTVGGVTKTYLTDWDFNTPTVVQFNTAPPVGTDNVRIYRDTDDSGLKAQFYPGSAIKAQDLNDNFTQNLYVTQETSNESASATTTANAAKTAGDAAKLATDNLVGSTPDGGTTWNTAGDGQGGNPKGVKYAIAESESAIAASSSATTTANNAKTAADAAKLAADTYVHDGTNLQGDGVSPNPKGLAFVLNAVDTYVHDGTNLQGDGQGANPKGVKYAVDSADLALLNSRESDGSGGYTTAIDKATAAKTSGDAAKQASDRLVATTSDGGATWNLAGNNTNASTDPKGVGYAITTAESAAAAASSAQAAVANSVSYAPIANVASVPTSPVDGDRIEINDSTGVESLSPLSGLPSGFTGDPFLTARLKYVTNTWVWQNYFSTDPEGRYVSIYGKHSTTQVNYSVKVITKTAAHRYHNTGSANGYTIDGVESPFLTLIPGNTYRFDQSDASNLNHPIAFYRKPSKTGIYTDSVTVNGTPGNAGAYTDLTVTDITPGTLSYQCQTHAYMGNGTTTNSGSGGGGATGGGADMVFIENDIAITTDYTISTNKNAMSTGPLTINNGIAVTVQQNSLWKVI